MAEIFNHQYPATGEYCGPSTLVVNSNYQWANWLPIVAACNEHCSPSVLNIGGVLLFSRRLTINGNGFNSPTCVVGFEQTHPTGTLVSSITVLIRMVVNLALYLCSWLKQIHPIMTFPTGFPRAIFVRSSFS